VIAFLSLYALGAIITAIVLGYIHAGPEEHPEVPPFLFAIGWPMLLAVAFLYLLSKVGARLRRG
jgi:hypothetical protein